MSPEAKLIAIAQAHGYTDVRRETVWEAVSLDSRHVASREGLRGTKNGQRYWIPRYLSDLNAMHELETKSGCIIGPREWDVYCDNLRKTITQQIERAGGPGSICGVVCLEMAVRATATQRACAFLQTLGLWREET